MKVKNVTSSNPTRGRKGAKGPSLVSQVQVAAYFGPPPLFNGEDSSRYDQFLTEVVDFVKPADVVEMIWLRDFVDLQWEVDRLRRIKAHLISIAKLDMKENVLQSAMSPYVLAPERDEAAAQEPHDDEALSEAQKNRERFTQALREHEAKQHSEDQKHSEDQNHDEDTDEDVSSQEIVWDLLFQGDDVSLVKAAELLGREGQSKNAFDILPDTLTARGFAKNIESLDSIERMLMTMEVRRDTALHQLEKRRATLGQRAQKAVEHVVDAEFQVVDDGSTQQKKAA